MLVHFNIAEMNSVVIDESSQLNFILETLPRSNAIINKISYNLTTILNELQTYQSLMKNKSLEGEANAASSNKKFLKGLTSRTKSGTSSSGLEKWKRKKAENKNKVAHTTTQKREESQGR